MTVRFLFDSLTGLDYYLCSSCKLRTHFDAAQFGRHLAAMCSLTQNLVGAGCHLFVHEPC